MGTSRLCVAVGGQVQRGGDGTVGMPSGATVRRSGMMGGSRRMCEDSGREFEVIVLRRDGQLQHYWRDGAGWHEGPVIGPA